MAGGALIGALRVTLGLDTAAFESGAGLAQKKASAFQKSFASIGANMTKAGVAISAGITAPFTALVSSAIPAAVESQQAAAQVNAALASMGPVAGRTADQLSGLAGKLQDLSNFDDDDIMKSVTANMLTFGKITGETFDRAQLAAINLSARLGQDLQSSAIQVGKALNDPIKGVTALQRVGVSFTLAQKEQIKAMTEAGNVAGAQAIILGELEKQFGGAAKAQRDATPTAAQDQAWRTFQETIGGLALKVLPPLTNLLTAVLNGFNSLSPGMQTVIVAGAAVAAALGPVLTVLGGLVQLGAPLMATFAAEGGLALGLSGLAPILLPLAAAIGGVYLAFKNWDQIGPYIDRVAGRISAFVADADAKFASVTKAANDFDTRMGIPTKDEFLGSATKSLTAFWTKINEYDLAAWARGVDASIATSATRIWQSFVTMHGRVQQAFNAMIDGISSAVTVRLSAIWDTIERKTKQAGDWFYNLYDRVVGHSYIPDMVDGVAAHIARLDGVMVRPIQTTTQKAGDAFAALKDRLNGLLDRLFPEQAQLRGLQQELADIDEALAKKLGDPAVWAKARKQVLAQIKQLEADVAAAKGDLEPDGIAVDHAVKTTILAAEDNAEAHKKANDQIIQSYAEMAQRVTGSLRGLVDSIKSGDVLDILQSVLDVASAFLGGGGGGGGLSGLGSIFGGGGGMEAPGFATGGSFKVGGRPGTDKNLIAFRATKGEMVDIRRPGQRPTSAQAAPSVVQLVVGEGQMFEPKVTAIAGNVSVTTTRRGANSYARSQRQALGRRW